MNSNFFVCNLCGLCSNGLMGDKNMALLKVDLTNYFLQSCGLVLDNGEVHLHFCPDCFAKVKDSEVKVLADGSAEKMRKDIDKLRKEKQVIEEEFNAYKRKVQSLLDK